MAFLSIYNQSIFRTCSLLFLLVATSSANAQETRLVLEEIKISEEAVKAEPELSKATCYRVWLMLPDSAESLLAVFGSGEFPLEIKSSEPFWQSAYGDFMGSNINSGMMQIHPELSYDSWVTVGMQHNRSAGTMYFLESPDQPWTSSFENGESLVINDRVGASWFSLPGQENTVKLDGRVLIGQFTTKGKLDLLINCQLKDKNNEPIRIHGLKANS
jgi:hypothetical protein